MVISGSDGYNYPHITIIFSDGTMSDVIITEEGDTFSPEEGDLCYLNGVVAGQIGSRVKLIGCIQTEERHESDQMTIILYAALDSGWYSVYYATEQDDFLTVKKIRQKNNVKGKVKFMKCLKLLNFYSHVFGNHTCDTLNVIIYIQWNS